MINAEIADCEPCVTFPRLMRHKPTKAIVLQVDRDRGILVSSNDRHNGIGNEWNIVVPENYEPFNGVITLSNA